jgi:hypothetical protein
MIQYSWKGFIFPILLKMHFLCLAGGGGRCKWSSIIKYFDVATKRRPGLCTEFNGGHRY